MGCQSALALAVPPPTKLNLPNARMPVKTASCRFVFVHVPKRHAISIDGSHAIIAPASLVSDSLPVPLNIVSFPLDEVTWRVVGKTSRITDPGNAVELDVE
jgi:hypothetical protein